MGVTRSGEIVSKVVLEGASSSFSVNNDWKNWVVLRGNEEVEVEDVRGMGKAIRINFKGDNHGRFIVLSRVKRDKEKKSKNSGVVEGGKRSRGVE